MNDPVLALLRDLVAIDSVNPALAPGGAGEAAIAQHVAAVMRRAGLDVAVAEAAPGRPNVVGMVEGRAPGRTLMLCGHLDTVGVEGMRDPFTPAVRALRGGLPAGRLLVAAVADEEHASLGADALVRDHAADGAVVTEPTDLRMATCHKGFEWVEVETRGRAAHGSRPADGRDAILRMGRFLARLEDVNARLVAGPAHPLLGPASLHASTIDGGGELSVYPDRCRLSFERRTLLGER